MQQVPGWYTAWRETLDFDEIECGVGGVRLFRPEQVVQGQVGFGVAADGRSIAGDRPGDWHREWAVIGLESACGDPIFASEVSPHPVFSAMAGEDTWEPQLVAPSLAVFGDCLAVFRRFAAGRRTPAEFEANAPTLHDQSEFIEAIMALTADHEAIDFWAAAVEFDLDA